MPLFVEKKNGKKIHINLNNFRNWHYQTANNIKRKYFDIAILKIPRNNRYKQVKLELTLYRGDNRRVDLSNVLCLHDKFFCDALSKSGIIPDDNCEHIRSITYLYGGIDKQDPRVDIKIIPIQ